MCLLFEFSATVDPSNPDTLGPESTVLIIEVSSFQGLEIRGVSPIQGTGLEGFHCSPLSFMFRGSAVFLLWY